MHAGKHQAAGSRTSSGLLTMVPAAHPGAAAAAGGAAVQVRSQAGQGHAPAAARAAAIVGVTGGHTSSRVLQSDARDQQQKQEQHTLNGTLEHNLRPTPSLNMPPQSAKSQLTSALKSQQPRLVEQSQQQHLGHHRVPQQQPPAEPRDGLPIREASRAAMASGSSHPSRSHSPTPSHSYVTYGSGSACGSWGLPPLDPVSLPADHPLQATTQDRTRRMSWKDAADMMVDGSGKRGWQEEASEEREEMEQPRHQSAAWQEEAWERDFELEQEQELAAAGHLEHQEQESGSVEDGPSGGDAGVDGDEEQEGEGGHLHQPRHASPRRPRKYLRARHHHHIHQHALTSQRPQHHHHLHSHQQESAPAAVAAPQQQQRPAAGLPLAPARPQQAAPAGTSQPRDQPPAQPSPQLPLQLPPQQLWPFTGSRVSSSDSAGVGLHATRPTTSSRASAAPAARQALQHQQQRPLQPEPASRQPHYYGRVGGAAAAPEAAQHPPEPRPLQPATLTQHTQQSRRQPLTMQPAAALPPQPLSPTTSLSQQSLLPQRSGDLYINTTPFFPLGPETSDFLDRAASIEVGIRHDPDLATTAADVDGAHGEVYEGGEESGPGSPPVSSGPGHPDRHHHQQYHHHHQTHHRTPSYDDDEDEEEYDDVDVGGMGGGTGSGMEPDDGDDNGIHDDLDLEDPGRATMGSASTYTFEDYDPEELAGEEDEAEDDPVGSNAGHSRAVSSSSSTGTGAGNTGSGEDAAAPGAGAPAAAAAGLSGLRSPKHTTASFRPVPQRGEAGGSSGTHAHDRAAGASGAAYPENGSFSAAAAAPAGPATAAQPPAAAGGLSGVQPQRVGGRAAAGSANTAAAAAAAATPDGPPVPPDVLARMAEHAGDEGLARPSTAVPSALRHSEPGVGPPVPPEVLSYMQQYTGGGEGDGRPPTASPSVLRAGAGSREVPVPPEVLSYMQQYTGDEGHARPSTAAPSVLAANRSMPELPVPEPVLHTAMLFQTGGEGISRPTTAPSSDERRTRLTAAASAPQLAPLPAALGPNAASSSPDRSPAHGAIAAAAAATSGGGSSGGAGRISPSSGVVQSASSPRLPLPAAPLRPPLQAPPTLAFQPQYLQPQPHLNLQPPQPHLQPVDLQPPSEAAGPVVRHFRHSSGSVGQGELLYEGEGLIRQDTGSSGRGAATMAPASVSASVHVSSSEAGLGGAAAAADPDSDGEQWPADGPGSSAAASDDDQGCGYSHVPPSGYERRQAVAADAAADTEADWRRDAALGHHDEGHEDEGIFLDDGHDGPEEAARQERDLDGEHVHVDYEAEEGGYEAEGPAAEPHLLHDPQDMHDQQFWQQLLEEAGFGEESNRAHLGAEEQGEEQEGQGDEEGLAGGGSMEVCEEEEVDDDGGIAELGVRGMGSQDEEEDGEDETGSSSMGVSHAMPSFSSAATFSDLPLQPQLPLPSTAAVAALQPRLQQPAQQHLLLQPQLLHMEEGDDEDGGVDDESGAFRVVVGSWLSRPATSAAAAPPLPAPATAGWQRGSAGPSPLGPAAAGSGSGAQQHARPNAAAASTGARGRSRQAAAAGLAGVAQQPAAAEQQVPARRRSLGQELALEAPYDPGAVDPDPQSAVWLLGAGLGVPHGEEGSDWERSSAASWA
ncbi:hypothetical protein CHLRE_12g547651v5 [Chlamydomonas reinhardtii]|uniref:Uncharacterized protein n=1 Tax=Chlamydomonas reinhardtii TaxID=3055 RepID=A0A2K3D6E3_CHLRE|nr:uncharacterized protein CHLRE_12g547651v5 [Chlamydomonas reinhardtii]PNW76105.1 hypothetical protein CHLRE_12g547651v5 [Chlamydomonas reinhardtii]